MSIEERDAIIDVNETLIEKFEDQAAKATTAEEECTALGLLTMVSERYNQWKKMYLS